MKGLVGELLISQTPTTCVQATYIRWYWPLVTIPECDDYLASDILLGVKKLLVIVYVDLPKSLL